MINVSFLVFSSPHFFIFIFIVLCFILYLLQPKERKKRRKMPFLQSVKDYTKRHRKGLFITAAIGGGSYLLGRYATVKLRDLQEKAMTERVAKEK